MPTEFSFQSRDEKKNYVERMFGQIAKRYDFFNHFLSLGFDYTWRKRAIQILKSELQEKQKPLILDIACGTGDLAFEALDQMPMAKMIGLDLTQPMLDIFAQKAKTRHLSVQLEKGDVENLRFEPNTVDGVTIGFGTRNFTHLETAFSEIYRVLKPGGVFINLELAKPRVFPMKQLYNFYFNGVLPLMGTVFSGHNSAYKYLPDSLRKFPDLEDLAEIMKRTGFRQVRWETRTAGIVAIHVAIK